MLLTLYKMLLERNSPSPTCVLSYLYNLNPPLIIFMSSFFLLARDSIVYFVIIFCRAIKLFKLTINSPGFFSNFGGELRHFPIRQSFQSHAVSK
jgi:hypothetical protein